MLCVCVCVCVRVSEFACVCVCVCEDTFLLSYDVQHMLPHFFVCRYSHNIDVSGMSHLSNLSARITMALVGFLNI